LSMDCGLVIQCSRGSPNGLLPTLAKPAIYSRHAIYFSNSRFLSGFRQMIPHPQAHRLLFFWTSDGKGFWGQDYQKTRIEVASK